MRVTFISPYVPYKFSKTPYPALGIGYLSAAIHLQSEFVEEIEFLDGQIMTKEDFEKNVSELVTDVALISATISQTKSALWVAGQVKARNPQAIVILGGAGPSTLFDYQPDVFCGKAVDFVVKGEAEEILPTLLFQILSRNSLEQLNYPVKFRGGVLFVGPPFNPPDVKKLPWPDRSIFRIDVYLQRWQESARMTSVHLMGSRGCFFRCGFCDHTVTGHKIRFREPQDVAAEMLFLEKTFTPNDIFYFDDLFTVKKRRVLKICHLIIKNSLHTSWSAQGRVDCVDEEMLTAMKTAGCSELMFGVESGSNRILSYLNKGFTRAQIIQAFDLCHKVGIRSGAYLIVGVPGEMRQDIEASVTLVEQIEPALLNFSFLTPFPGTPLYQATKHLVKDWDFEKWDDFNNTIYDYPFEIDPRKARDLIRDAYLKKIKSGMPYSAYQFANEVQNPV